MNEAHCRRESGRWPPEAVVLAALLLTGLACAEGEPRTDERSAEPAARMSPPNADSAAAVRRAFALTPGLDSTQLRVLSYERTDSGHEVVVSEAMPPDVVQFDGDWTVLVDSATKTARFLSPPPR